MLFLNGPLNQFSWEMDWLEVSWTITWPTTVYAYLWFLLSLRLWTSTQTQLRTITNSTKVFPEKQIPLKPFNFNVDYTQQWSAERRVWLNDKQSIPVAERSCNQVKRQTFMNLQTLLAETIITTKSRNFIIFSYTSYNFSPWFRSECLHDLKRIISVHSFLRRVITDTLRKKL